jgi:transcription termination factor Rho
MRLPALSARSNPMQLSELKSKHVSELLDIANTMEIEGANRMRKHDLIFAMLKSPREEGREHFRRRHPRVLPRRLRFLRSPDTSYLAGTDDIYFAVADRRFNLHTGDTIEGEIRTPKDGERYFALVKVDKVNSEPPENAKNKILFENLTPLFRRGAHARTRHQGRGEHQPAASSISSRPSAGQRGLSCLPEVRQDGDAAARRAFDRRTPAMSC